MTITSTGNRAANPLATVAALAAAVAAAGCTTRGAATGRGSVEPFYAIEMTEGGGLGRSAPDPGGAARAYAVEARLVGADGTTLAAPRIVVFPRQRANVEIANWTAARWRR